MAEQQPAVDDNYPSEWTPAWLRRQREQERQERNEFELHVSALTDEELKRIRGER